MHALGRAILAVGQGLAALLAAWAIGWLATGDSFAAVRAGLYLAPFLLGLAAALAVAALLAGRRTAGLAAAAVALALGAAAPASLTRIAPPTPVPVPVPGTSLVTLSNRTANADMASTAAVLRRHRADIVVLQEVADPAALVAGLAGLYRPGRPPGHCSAGTYLIVSRYLVGPAASLAGNAAMRCRVRLPAGPAMVYSVHLPRAIRDSHRQDRAIATLLADAARQTDPVILAGDFNATPLTATMRRAGRDLLNAFDRAGTGPGFTFPTPARRLGAFGPFLRIDHVLLGRAFRAATARAARWHPPGADHFPVEIRFRDLRRAGQ